MKGSCDWICSPLIIQSDMLWFYNTGSVLYCSLAGSTWFKDTMHALWFPFASINLYCYHSKRWIEKCRRYIKIRKNRQFVDKMIGTWTIHPKGSDEMKLWSCEHSDQNKISLSFFSSLLHREQVMRHSVHTFLSIIHHLANLPANLHGHTIPLEISILPTFPVYPD